MGSSGVQASITGGRSRSLSEFDTLVLDASVSQDTDYPEMTPALRFTWTCSSLSPEAVADCLTPLVTLAPQPIATSGAVLTIPGKMLAKAVSVVYNFTAMISNTRNSTNACSVVIVVGATGGPPPPNAIISNVAKKYNPDTNIILNYTVSMPSAGSSGFQVANDTY